MGGGDPVGDPVIRMQSPLPSLRRLDASTSFDFPSTLNHIALVRKRVYRQSATRQFALSGIENGAVPLVSRATAVNPRWSGQKIPWFFTSAASNRYLTTSQSITAVANHPRGCASLTKKKPCSVCLPARFVAYSKQVSVPTIKNEQQRTEQDRQEEGEW